MHRKIALAGAALALSLLAACSGPQDPAPTSASAAPSPTAAEAPAASDAGGASDQGGAPETLYAVTPPPQPVELTNDCTGEGMHRAAMDQAADPALPERDGRSMEISMAGLDTEGRVILTVDLDGAETGIVEPAAVGDTVMIEGWTISVTSICADEVEFDLVN